MSHDLRQFNGGPRKGAGRPKTINSYRQIAVRLPEDMARWVLRHCRGSEAELLRRLVKEAMERDAQASVITPEKEDQSSIGTDRGQPTQTH